MKHAITLTIGVGALVWMSSLSQLALAQEPPPRYVAGQVIAKFGASASGSAITTGVLQAGGSVKRKMAASGGSVVLVQFSPETTTLEEMITRLEANAKVVYAEPNYIIPIAWPFRPWMPHGGTLLRMRSGTDADGRPTFYETSRRDVLAGASFPTENPALDRWGWFYGGAGVAWESIETAPPVTLVDTGVDYRHPDLKNAVLIGPDILEGDGNPMDDNGHGTHMAGIIAARLNNGVGISGISRGEVLAIKAFDRAGLGSHYDVAQALYKAATSTPKLVVIGGSGPDESITLREAVNQLVNKSAKMLIAPAGDAGSNAPYYPAAYANWATPARPISFIDRVLAVSAEGVSVTASAAGGEAFVEYCQAPFANYGSWVSIVAPGVDIYSTTPFGRDFYYRAYGGSTTGYDSYNGTSMAAAYVAGTVARQLSTAAGTNTLNLARRLVGSGGLPSLEAYTGPVDVDSDGIDELAGCWDATWAKAGPRRALDLAEANVGMAMGRSAIWGYVDSALDGTSIDGLYGIILNWGYPNLRRQGAPTPAGGHQYEILNVKWFDKQYQMRVRKDGITNGPAIVGTIKIDDRAIWKEFDYLSLPPTGRWSIVTTWGKPHLGGVDLDQHVIFPLAGTNRCDIGPTDPGLATNPSDWCGVGSILAPPWVNYAYSRSGDRSVRTTFIKTPLNPTEREPYRIFLREFNQGADFNDPVRGWPTMRIWIGGIVKREVRFGNDTLVQPSPACSIEGGTADCSIWHVGDLLTANPFTFNPKNELGDGVNTAYVP